jgi:hypothetical protein
VGGEIFAAADGYWAFLNRLPPGMHKTSFKGHAILKIEFGADYQLHII